MAKVVLSQSGKGKKLVLKVNVAAKGLPNGTANVVGLWREDTNEIVGHTDVVKDSTDPIFTTEFHLDHLMGSDVPLKFCVYSVTKDPLDETCFVGAYITSLNNLFKQKKQDQAMEAGNLLINTTVLADPNAPKKEKKAPVPQQKKMTSEEKKAKKEAEAAAKAAEKAKRAAYKEGGKKGQDLCGMSAFGVHHFCVSLESPGSDWNLMQLVMDGMNKDVDPEGDDRKGGAKDIAKILFCAAEDKLIIYAHVPVEQQKGTTCKDFLEACCSAIDVKPFEQSEFYGKAEVSLDIEKGRFPIKLKDEAIAAGFAFLRSRELILDDDSDDEINFADECGIDLNAGADDGEDY